MYIHWYLAVELVAFLRSLFFSHFCFCSFRKRKKTKTEIKLVKSSLLFPLSLSLYPLLFKLLLFFLWQKLVSVFLNKFSIYFLKDSLILYFLAIKSKKRKYKEEVENESMRLYIYISFVMVFQFLFFFSAQKIYIQKLIYI